MHRPRARRSGALLAAAIAALTLAGAAAGDHTLSLPEANVAVHVESNGALLIDEHIQYAVSGTFTGGYRDVPLRPGESVTNVTVLENGQAYRPGGCTELGCFDSPGTYGVDQLSDATRVVWHYNATDTTRTFEIRYTLSGLAVAYDDIVDVNLNVWGDEWKESLGKLSAVLDAPGKVVRAWGNPVYVRGDVQLAGPQVVLRALDVPAQQFVELRALIPRSAFTSTTGMHIAHGNGLQKIVGQELADAASFQKDHDRIEHAKRHPWRYLLYVFLLGLVPAAAVVSVVYWFYGREFRSAYDREYEQEPPTDTAPALVPTLLREGGDAGSFEFTATLFDLIRRGVYSAKPVTTQRSTWGGLHKEDVADLEISAGKKDGTLKPWEQEVADVVDGVLDGGSARLSSFRDTIKDKRATMSAHFTSFKTDVKSEVETRRWFSSRGSLLLVLALVVFGAIGALTLFAAAQRWRSASPRWSDVVLVGIFIAALLNTIVVLAALTHRAMWRKRSQAANDEAKRWEAFRHYLTDFPRLKEAPPATLALWEQLLVYGIAFGIADRVLQAAHLAMPEDLATASPIYWISPGGNLGGGASSIGINDLAAGFGSALAPPGSGAGGGGGGFSGGGGGGAGGGGGGGW